MAGAMGIVSERHVYISIACAHLYRGPCTGRLGISAKLRFSVLHAYLVWGRKSFISCFSVKHIFILPYPQAAQGGKHYRKNLIRLVMLREMTYQGHPLSFMGIRQFRHGPPESTSDRLSSNSIQFFNLYRTPVKDIGEK